jgi:hypothetical protein
VIQVDTVNTEKPSIALGFFVGEMEGEGREGGKEKACTDVQA